MVGAGAGLIQPSYRSMGTPNQSLHVSVPQKQTLLAFTMLEQKPTLVAVRKLNVRIHVLGT